MTLPPNANPKLVCIRTRIPKTYQKQPIISRLISRYALKINIAAALLGTRDRNDGWLDLEFQGSPQQIEAGLAYLQELNIEIFKLTLKSLLEAKREKSQLLGVISDSELPIEEIHTIPSQPENDLTVQAGQTTRTKFQVCIPKNYRSQPVIAELVSRYGLTINITSALLGAEAEDDGWFDLELWGSRRQILLGVRYLKQLGSQTW